MKRGAILGCWICSVLGLTGMAQDAVWTNVIEGVVQTGAWHTAGNWLPNAVPVAGQNVRLTNAVESYVVEVNEPVTAYATSGTAQTLFMSAPVGKSVTLDVNDDITGSAALADNTKRVTLNLGARGVVNVAAGKSIRLVAPASASTDNMMYGTLNVDGTAYWHHPADADGMHHTRINIRSGGVLSTLGQSSTDNLTLGGYSQVAIGAGGLWTYSPNSVRDIRMVELQGQTPQILVEGALDLESGSLKIGAGNSNTTTFPEVHVYTGGWLRVQGSAGEYLAVSHPGWRYDGGGKFFLNGGAVTNNGYLHVAHGRGNDKNVYSRGELNITSGTWRNQGWTLIGGYPPSAFDWPVSGTSPGWQYPPKLLGTYTQTDGDFRALDDVHVARGPATSTVTLSGGRMIATNAAGTVLMSMGFAVRDSGSGTTNGEILPGRATLALQGGDLIVDELIGTNGVEKTSSNIEGHSVINFQAGSLSVKNSTLDLGIPLTVGDGTQTATLTLLGGTHSSAFGYVINSNATLAVGGSGAVTTVALAGNVALEQDANLRVGLVDAETAYVLEVTGSVVLDGQLVVTGVGEYEPSDGTQWTVLTASGGITGGLSGVTEGYKAEVLGGDTLVVTKNRSGTMLLLR